MPHVLREIRILLKADWADGVEVVLATYPGDVRVRGIGGAAYVSAPHAHQALHSFFRHVRRNVPEGSSIYGWSNHGHCLLLLPCHRLEVVVVAVDCDGLLRARFDELREMMPDNVFP